MDNTTYLPAHAPSDDLAYFRARERVRAAAPRGRKRAALLAVVFLTVIYSQAVHGRGRRLAPKPLRALIDVVRKPMQIISEIPGPIQRQGAQVIGGVAKTVRERLQPARTPFRERNRQARSVEHLSRLLDQLPLNKLSVKGEGETANNLRKHPVVKLMHERVSKGYTPGKKKDGNKIALAIEGGGMRGAVSAGMAHAVTVLGLNDAVDCVYGSSAGAIVGAYFVSRQASATGVYSDLLPCAKTRFLDVRGLLPAVLPSRGLESREDLEYPEWGAAGWFGGGLGEVFNLTFLLEDIMGRDGHYPLDWETFRRNNDHQPLHVVAAAPLTRRSVALSEKAGHFSSLSELFSCMKASMNVPGLAGPPQYLPPHQSGGSLHRLGEQWGAMSGRCEPLVDALLYEPIPYRQAVADGATHVLVLRTRAEDAEVLGKDNAGGVWEHHICGNYFRRYGLHGAANFMKQLGDKRIYAEDVLTFSEAASGDGVRVPPPMGRRPSRTPGEATDEDASTYVMNLVPPSGEEGMAEMEMDREKILMGLRSGFAAAVDALATEEQLETLGSGAKAALDYFPEGMLLSEYDFNQKARERLLEAGVKIYKETDRNSRLLRLLDQASTAATVPLKLPLHLLRGLRERRRARKAASARAAAAAASSKDARLPMPRATAAPPPRYTNVGNH